MGESTSRKSIAKATSGRRASVKISLQRARSPEAKFLDRSSLESVYTVGGTVPRTWTKQWDIDTSTLAMLLADRCSAGQNLYLHLVSEGLDKASYPEMIRREADMNVPILIATACEVEPTTLIFQFSLQSQEEDIISMSSFGLKWMHIAPKVYALKAVGSSTAFGEYFHLPIVRPSQICSERPKEVTTVSVRFNGVKVVATCDRLEDDVDDYIEDGDIQESDRGVVIVLLREEHSASRDAERAKVEQKSEAFQAMVDELSQESLGVLGKLESMRHFKIYPTNAPQPKKTYWAGLETGFRRMRSSTATRGLLMKYSKHGFAVLPVFRRARIDATRCPNPKLSG
mmetsp:Transcript_26783/g.79148  ORF Transcript_26783/g.79148 Transcript_26783/m.79148 type:complete len:342 (-) Transcript_26783:153-1178(-)